MHDFVKEALGLLKTSSFSDINNTEISSCIWALAFKWINNLY